MRSKTITRSVETAQKRVEGNNFDARKHLLQYDDVMGRHREIMYAKRNEILDKEDHFDSIEDYPLTISEARHIANDLFNH